MQECKLIVLKLLSFPKPFIYILKILGIAFKKYPHNHLYSFNLFYIL